MGLLARAFAGVGRTAEKLRKGDDQIHPEDKQIAHAQPYRTREFDRGDSALRGAEARLYEFAPHRSALVHPILALGPG
jgi:hypothetical protein